MSVVTNITIFASGICGFDSPLEGSVAETYNIDIVQSWLKSDEGGNYHQGFRPMRWIVGGNTFYEVEAWMGAFKSFHIDGFLDFMGTLRFEAPEKAVVVIHPDEGPAIVWRPAHAGD